ncbi:MAG TPA: hypothetical protein VFW07_19345 [Parafilimonas sp.]|nr:hypothetical protein [Parafilimonas sp.]
MKLTVTDANIFIDLIKLQMLGFLFSIKVEVYTTHEVAEQLNNNQYEKISSFIQAQLLTVVDFTDAQIEEIAALQVSRALEFADKTVIYLAAKLNAAVLSGDGPLRKACQKQLLTVHGILWLFQQFLEHDLISHSTAITKLNHLQSFNNRLPKEECLKKLAEWKQHETGKH